jgi:hypothetical protein
MQPPTPPDHRLERDQPGKPLNDSTNDQLRPRPHRSSAWGRIHRPGSEHVDRDRPGATRESTRKGTDRHRADASPPQESQTHAVAEAADRDWRRVTSASRACSAGSPRHDGATSTVPDGWPPIAHVPDRPQRPVRPTSASDASGLRLDRCVAACEGQTFASSMQSMRPLPIAVTR